jgi:hypothetical protein
MFSEIASKITNYVVGARNTTIALIIGQIILEKILRQQTKDDMDAEEMDARIQAEVDEFSANFSEDNARKRYARNERDNELRNLNEYLKNLHDDLIGDITIDRESLEEFLHEFRLADSENTPLMDIIRIIFILNASLLGRSRSAEYIGYLNSLTEEERKNAYILFLIELMCVPDGKISFDTEVDEAKIQSAIHRCMQRDSSIGYQRRKAVPGGPSRKASYGELNKSYVKPGDTADYFKRMQKLAKEHNKKMFMDSLTKRYDREASPIYAHLVRIRKDLKKAKAAKKILSFYRSKKARSKKNNGGARTRRNRNRN